MKNLFITKENLKALINTLKKTCAEFIAPKREHLEDVIFGDAKYDSGELLDYEGNSIVSPRAFLLPQTEPLLEIKSAKNSTLKPIEDKTKRIFYGVRPCDIKALVLMRKFFIDDAFVDIPYKQKMDNAIFISLACGKRCLKKSFCHKMDAGPVAKEGFDLQLIPISRGYIVEVGSNKGSEIVKKYKKLFSKATIQDEKEIKTMLKNFAEKIKKIDFKKVAKIMQEDKVAPEIWEDIGLRCVVCSGCITLCPTCSCFGVTDRLDPIRDYKATGKNQDVSNGVNGDRGIRFRYCDGCPYAGFTRMAGGSTPFPLHKDHIRRFFEHKLNVDVERYGTPSCVGCARCIQTCPGNISIRKFVEEVADSV